MDREQVERPARRAPMATASASWLTPGSSAGRAASRAPGAGSRRLADGASRPSRASGFTSPENHTASQFRHRSTPIERLISSGSVWSSAPDTARLNARVEPATQRMSVAGPARCTQMIFCSRSGREREQVVGGDRQRCRSQPRFLGDFKAASATRARPPRPGRGPAAPHAGRHPAGPAASRSRTAHPRRQRAGSRPGSGGPSP